VGNHSVTTALKFRSFSNIVLLSYALVVVRRALKRGPRLERPCSNEDASAPEVGKLTVRVKRDDRNDVSETQMSGSQAQYLETQKLNRKVFVEGGTT
jgi:hypothetical protein